MVKKMTVQIKEYGSSEEIAGTLDKQISETKTNLGEYLRKLEEIQVQAEKSKKLREVLLKLAGKKMPVENLGEITIGSLNVVLDATPVHELTAIESVVQNQQERLLNLQKAREGLKWLDQLGDTQGLKFIVVENENIPERILLKVS
jgi:hypothetical protein